MGRNTVERVGASPGSGRLPTLVVFCKLPAPGVGKQRLAATLGVGAALQVAQALLECALEDALAWPGPVALAPADARDAPWARGVLDRPVRVVVQPDGGFGERLESVDRELRKDGGARLLFIGSDAPGLDDGYYTAARRALESHDVVLGPARDGGVTLMGARIAWPRLADLAWSHSSIAAQLASRCRKLGASIATLPLAYDVDTFEDLVRAEADLRLDSRTARRKLLHVLEPLVAGRVA